MRLLFTQFDSLWHTESSLVSFWKNVFSLQNDEKTNYQFFPQKVPFSLSLVPFQSLIDISVYFRFAVHHMCPLISTNWDIHPTAMKKFTFLNTHPNNKMQTDDAYLCNMWWRSSKWKMWHDFVAGNKRKRSPISIQCFNHQLFRLLLQICVYGGLSLRR